MKFALNDGQTLKITHSLKKVFGRNLRTQIFNVPLNQHLHPHQPQKKLILKQNYIINRVIE